MVSLWPFKGETSAADFEKTLSTLATRIQKVSTRNDKLRHNSRRFKVLWTLYAGFAYILLGLSLTLITRWQNWTAKEITALASGPIVIVAVRRALSAYYDYRLNNTQTYLDSLYKERDTTIEKLKTATKYNSTQQLLEKYGGSPQSGKKSAAFPGRQQRKVSQGDSRGPQQQPGPQRTNIAPPPTANIPRGPPPTANIPRDDVPQGLPGPGQAPPGLNIPPHMSPTTSPRTSQLFSPSSADLPPGAEFAPNAFATPPQHYVAEPKWYDRIMDVLLGEDDSQAKNRLALLCEQCRLVNGLAPPGIKTLEELGRWKCSSCGAWNGKENEAKKLVEHIEEQRRDRVVERETEDDEADDDSEEPIRLPPDSDDEEDDEGSHDRPPAQSTRSRTK